MGNSLLKYRQNNNYVEYRRDSFSHRICDDLCEEILQYLSLKDKLRLQCVSKQFQRTVLERQHELRILYSSRYLFMKTNIKSFESLLKKCPNITSVYTTYNFWHNKNRMIDYNEWLELIINNCQYLTKVNIDFYSINLDILEKFINKFATRLKYFESANVPCSKILTTLKNVETMNLNICNYSDIVNYKFSRLKKLFVNIYDENSTEVIMFIQNNPGIKSLSVTLNVNDPINANSILIELAKLKNLVHFNYIFYPINDELFDRGLTQLALKCTKLKSIVCQVKTQVNNYFKINEILHPLKKFKHLKRLDLRFAISISDDQLLNSINLSEYYILPLFGMEGITDLSLSFYGYSTDIIEKIINNLLINMTKLTRLDIRSQYIPSKRTALVLSSLNHLEHVKLHLSGSYKIPWSDIESALYKNCANIKSVEIRA